MALLAAVALSAPGLGQDPPPPAVGDYSDSVSVTYVLVPVVARSSKGYVTDLQADDFELYVDSRRTEIESFESGTDLPVSLLFLQDVSGSMEIGGKMRTSKRAIAGFLSRRRPGDRYALASFALDQVNLDVPFTNDLDRLQTAMDRWKGFGTTALHDAVAWLPEMTIDAGSLKRAAVLITDGVDNASNIDPAAARDKVRRAEIPVYVMGLEAAAQPVRAQGEALRYRDLLAQLAWATGGRYYKLTNLASLIAATEEVSTELGHQYVLGFTTRSHGTPRYRELEVMVRKGKLRLAYRRGYTGRGPRLMAPSD